MVQKASSLHATHLYRIASQRLSSGANRSEKIPRRAIALALFRSSERPFAPERGSCFALDNQFALRFSPSYHSLQTLSTLSHSPSITLERTKHPRLLELNASYLVLGLVASYRSLLHQLSPRVSLSLNTRPPGVDSLKPATHTMYEGSSVMDDFSYSQQTQTQPQTQTASQPHSATGPSFPSHLWGLLVSVSASSSPDVTNTVAAVQRPQRFEFTWDKKQITVGRHPACDLRLNSAKISSDHARIWWDEEAGVVKLEDKSTNGTYVANRKVSEHGSHPPSPVASCVLLSFPSPRTRLSIARAAGDLGS